MFSWSRQSGGRGNTSSSHKQRYTRQQHISSYLTDPTLKPSTRVVDVNSTYDTVFQTTDRHTLLLRVHMPSGSLTISAPKMTLVGIRAVHPWVDSKMRVIGYPPIRNDSEFANSGLLLSQAVNAVVQQFQMHPPRQVVFVDKSLKDLQSHLGNNNANANAATTTSTATNHNHTRLSQQSASPPSPPPPPKYNLPPSFHHSLTFTQTDQQTQQATLNDITMPHIPPTFHAYNDMDRAEMMQLMESNADTETADKFIQPILIPLPCVQETEALKATLHEANTSFANRTIQSSQRELSEIYSQVKNLQSSLKDKIDTMNDLQRQQMELCKPMKTKDILSKLKKAKKETFEESEDIANEWLDRARQDDENADVDAFLEEFMHVRTLHHVRSAKMERIEKAM